MKTNHIQVSQCSNVDSLENHSVSSSHDESRRIAGHSIRAMRVLLIPAFGFGMLAVCSLNVCAQTATTGEQARQNGLRYDKVPDRKQSPASNGGGNAYQQQNEKLRQQARQMEAESRARQEAMRQKATHDSAKMRQANQKLTNSMNNSISGNSSSSRASSSTSWAPHDPDSDPNYDKATGSYRNSSSGGSGNSSGGISSRGSQGASGSSKSETSGSGSSSKNQQDQARKQQQAYADEEWRKSSAGLYGAFSKGLGGGSSETPEAPWGFGPSDLSVSPQQVGLPPQPDGAIFTNSDGVVTQDGYRADLEGYVNNYALTRAMSGRPLPPDFFDRDPAVVKYDSIGNPIDCDGFVVEYQSPAHRQAAIIEARLTAAENAIRDSKEYDWFPPLDLTQLKESSESPPMDIQSGGALDSQARLRRSMMATAPLINEIWKREVPYVDTPNKRILKEFYDRVEARVKKTRAAAGLPDE